LETARRVFRRHWRLILLTVAIIIIFGLLYALRSAIFPFVIGLVLAYLILPVISWVEKRLPRPGRWQQTKRVSLIILTFIVILGLVGFLSFYIVTAVISAFSALVQNANLYISAGLATLQDWAEFLRQQFPPEMQQQVDAIILDAGTAFGNAVRNIFTKGIAFIPTTFSLFFGFASLPIFLFYILKDSEKLKKGFYSAFSPQVAEHTRNIISILDEVLGRYIRAQVMLGIVVGYFCFIGLMILQVPFAPALAAFAGVTELIPILGPWIGGATAVIITLAVAPGKAIWVALLYLLVQLLENNLLVPRIQGGYLRIHPAVLMVILVVGAYVAGFWGILIAAPLTATIVEIYKYVRDSIKAEETVTPQPQEQPSTGSARES
jgi:predicted PurR-regulated permease PerM